MSPRSPRLCLVTDRRRLAAFRGLRDDDALTLQVLVAHAAEAAAAGIDIIQIRERDLEAGLLLDLTRRVVEAVAGRAAVVVNDRLDVALAAHAAGVHLPEHGLPPALVRGVTAGGFLIGRSVHGDIDVASGRGADYLLFGTVFASASKPRVVALAGIEGLRHACRAVATPVLAIGGIGLEQVAAVAAAGAAGVAAIDLFLTEPGGLHRIAPEIRRRFDSPEPVS